MELTQTLTSVNKVHSPQLPLILAVEDNEDNLVLMSYALESFGYRFICRQESYSTMHLAKEYRPDLILLDILLPGQNGLETVKILKREPLTCQIPVIAVTALAAAEDQENIMLAGFDDYICKPFLIEDLESKIHHYLHKKLNPHATFGLYHE